MALVQSSPWLDASNYGQGLGNALGQVLLQLPQVRAQIAQQIAQSRMQQAQFGLEQQRFGLEQQRATQQYGLEKERVGLEGQRLGVERGRMGIEQQRATTEAAYRTDLAKRAEEQAQMLQLQMQQRRTLGDVGNQMALMSAQQLPAGQQGPPAPTMDSLMFQALGQSGDASELAKVMMEREKMGQEQYGYAPAGSTVFNKKTGEIGDTAAPKPNTLLSNSPGVIEESMRLLGDPEKVRSLNPSTSNLLHQVVHQGLGGVLGNNTNQPRGPMFARRTNPDGSVTRIVSMDGGVTWRPAQ